MGLRKFKIILAVGGILWLISSASAQEVQYEKMDDDQVEHWYHPKSQRSWFQIQVEKISNVLWAGKKAPFGRSVALLTGVSDYQYLTPDLPSVENDLRDMRKFLLQQGGFDEVFVIKNSNLNRNIIERYIKDELPKRVGRDGRLLFYFSGHGADKRGSNTGYMQFSKARADQFYGDEVLAVKSVETWSDEVEVKHLLALLDCCSSGLAFADKGKARCDQAIFKTLSGNGSRVVATAGTADQKTYALKARDGGNGIFTRAFLDVFASEAENVGKCGLFTIDEVISQVKRNVSEFSSRYQKEVTPRIWTLADRTYQGTFVFLNPGVKKLTFTDQQIAAGDLVRKSGAATGDKYGTLRVISQYDGLVIIDGAEIGQVAAGAAMEYFPVKTGRRSVTVTGSGDSNTQKITVSQDRVARLVFRRKSLPDLASKTPDLTPGRRQPTYDLRKTAKTLSQDDAKKMLRKYDYYSTDQYSWSKPWSNPQGKGIDNEFAVQMNGKVVYDAATGLSWQQSGSSNMTFKKAEAYIQKLNREDHGGYSDWRLPTLEEAMSLMEPKELNGDLHIDSKFDKTQRWIWTADKKSASRAWVVYFSNGDCSFNVIDIFFVHVRAVR
ncbi:DUF1566 domain-containing protein [candidate division KSB1 bacterium]|nr:DUF1566 domain-containing protein [candidate division KSB1 bacterium]